MAKNNTPKFAHLLEKMVLLSENDTVYYDNIHKLINNNLISKLITYESINKTVIKNNLNKIFLFGKISLDSNYTPTSDWVLCGEEINPKVYYSAAMAIADSRCIIIDNKFLSLNVGNSLANYITSKCSVFLLDNKKHNSNIKNVNIIPLSPKSFIEQLIHIM